VARGGGGPGGRGPGGRGAPPPPGSSRPRRSPTPPDRRPTPDPARDPTGPPRWHVPGVGPGWLLLWRTPLFLFRPGAAVEAARRLFGDAARERAAAAAGASGGADSDGLGPRALARWRLREGTVVLAGRAVCGGEGAGAAVADARWRWRARLTLLLWSTLPAALFVVAAIAEAHRGAGTSGGEGDGEGEGQGEGDGDGAPAAPTEEPGPRESAWMLAGVVSFITLVAVAPTTVRLWLASLGKEARRQMLAGRYGGWVGWG